MCTALGTAASPRESSADAGASRTPIAVVELSIHPSLWEAPAARVTDGPPPRAVTVRALHDGDHLSKVSAVELANGSTLAAWVTYVQEPASDATPKKPTRDARRGAALSLRSIAPDGMLGSTVTLTGKAVSAGGLALAAGPVVDGKPQESALAYVAREGTDAQVFLARLGPTGEKLAQRPVTSVSRRAKKKGDGASEALDVAIARSDEKGDESDSWVTAWVDTRNERAGFMPPDSTATSTSWFRFNESLRRAATRPRCNLPFVVATRFSRGRTLATTQLTAIATSTSLI